MFAATALDAWTTYFLLSGGLGVEKNPVLAPLAQHSLLWVPVYLFTPTLLVPAMPDVCRQSFAAFYLGLGLLLGINNLRGIVAGSFFLIDGVGFPAVVAACLFVGATVFAVQLSTASARKASLRQHLAVVVVWTTFFCFFEGLYYVAGRHLS